jgi:uncharacterized membrane protein
MTDETNATPPPVPIAPTLQQQRSGLFSRLRTWFLAGLLITAPLALTLYVTLGIVHWVDDLISPLIPPSYRPEIYFNLPFAIPGTGLVVVVVGLTLIGALAATLLGRFFVHLSDRVLARLPIIRSLYGALKQMFETLLSQKSGAFRQVVLVQFPVVGSWAIGFITGETMGAIQTTVADELITVFVPTSPNPTSGYILFVRRTDAITVDLTVEEGLKLVVSGGIVSVPAA